MKKIILASQSPQKAEILKILGINFEIIPSDFDEIINPKLSNYENIKNFSFGKANDVAQKSDDAIIIGVDTVIIFDNQIIGKPKNIDQAINFLKSFSGNCLEIITGLTLIDTDTQKISSEVISSKAYFRDLQKDEILNFVNKTNPLNKAGGFGIQELGSILIDRIEGDYNNIVGLPLTTLYLRLKEFGINIL